MSAAPPEVHAGLSRTPAGDDVPVARERVRRRRGGEDPLVAWSAAIGLTVLAFFLRAWHLGTPREFAFDETYYAKDGWSMLNFGYVRDYVGGADKRMLDGDTTGVFKETPSMIVHPEVGKWLIALGEKAFGMDPFGWRISAAVVGSLMVLVMCRLVRRMTGSTLLGCVAGLLLMLDGLHLVLSRLALLDIFVAFFTLCGVACIVNDRDWYRTRMARLVPDGVVTRGWGPVRGLLLRPWLLAGGVCWGLAVGTKWAAVYPLAGFGLLVWAWSWGARRSFGVRRPVLRSAVADGVPAFLHLVVVALVVYVASWGGWLAHADQYERYLSSTQYTHHDGDPDWPTKTEDDASGLGEVTQSLRSLWYYHQDVYTFHKSFLDDSEHTYQSQPSGWLLLNRPVGVDAQVDIQPGDQGCEARADSDCLRQVLLLGTPAIWWTGIVALLYAVARWLGARDWRFGVAVVGTATTWLPWLADADRPIFLFYAIMTLPFVVIALALALGRLLGRGRSPTPRRTAGVIVAGTFLVVVVLNHAWFYPIWTDQLLTHDQWIDRMWFDRWI